MRGEMTILQFPKKFQGTRPLDDFLSQEASNPNLDQRAAELLPRATETVKQFSQDALAYMLAHNAARLEHTGFKVFL
jgi:hypothetical protein